MLLREAGRGECDHRGLDAGKALRDRAGAWKETEQIDAVEPAGERTANQDRATWPQHAPQLLGAGAEVRDVVDHRGEPGAIAASRVEWDPRGIAGKIPHPWMWSQPYRLMTHRLRRFDPDHLDLEPLRQRIGEDARTRAEIEHRQARP